MPDKLEVLAGPGLVGRFGDVFIWAGPQATPALFSHLVTEAQRAGTGPNAADQLASSFIAVLQRGDPEPQAPFAIAGPGANGLTLFLHGPVQAWDSGRWLAPQPVPGWMVTSIGRPWPLIVLAYGAPPPPPSQPGNPFDLVQGVVPGSGFVLLRPMADAPAAGAGQPAGAGASPAVVPTGWSGPLPAHGGTTGAAPPYGPSPTGPSPGPTGPSPTGFGPGPSGFGPSPTAIPSPAPGPTPGPGPAAPPTGVPFPVVPGLSRPEGVVDMRSVSAAYRPPLSLASDPLAAPGLTRPNVLGVNCELGHFNHPRAARCARCGRAIAPGTPQLSGPRPPVGVLLADDGSLWSLAQTCLIGSDAATASEVRSGSAQAISLRAGANHTMAPVQTEVQLRDWDAYLVDRGAEGGAWSQGPEDGGSWRPLGRNEQRLLVSGSHISCGGRVLTFLSAWPA